MRTILLGVAALAFSTSLAFADDVMASRYGNTTIATDPSGLVTKLYYSADGTFKGTQGGAPFSGTWKIDPPGTICLVFPQKIEGMTSPFCAPVVEHKVGDKWSAAGRSLSLVQGIQ
ncbi:MAG TPA: hypothetical protein VMU22_10635 [Rhizomicrobium sp.]|nr:hypothetical protein [Rhizomicrobium sp.]